MLSLIQSTSTVQLTIERGAFIITTPNYRLKTAVDRPFVYLDGADGVRLAELFVPSSIHTTGVLDDTTSFGPWCAEEEGDKIVLTAHARSTAWQLKVYRFHCYLDRVVFEVEVTGEGALTDVHLFGGYYSGTVRWGSGFFYSGQRFRQVFNPEPNMDETNLFSPAEGSKIDLMGVPLPGRGDWFFTPTPFCYAFEHSAGWLSVGIEARPGEHQFTEYRYHGQRGAFHMTLTYEGQTTVSGTYTLPAVGFHFAETLSNALTAHTQTVHKQLGLTPHTPAAWWRQPIFCGWGAQCYAARGLKKVKPQDFARQPLYEDFLASFPARGIEPGVVVLDDKWQKTYGENAVDEAKWPDLPGFVRQQHALGRKVLLWLKAWDPEGLPADECIRNAGGLPIAMDPSNPRCEQRLRAQVRRMLGPDGYDADGFKIDFTARVPSGPGLKRAGRAWGLELMKLYLSILYDETKQVKPDALVMTHTPHPYLADVVDMIRLNDINKNKDVNQAMIQRARIAMLACPNAIIDTDNWPITDRETWRAYIPLQARLGVPSLYYTSHIDSTGEALEDEDYQLIRDTWKTYVEAGRGTEHA
ncbi:MAG: hypothetical protein KIT87_12590 [Anaerolineae bacterium]|nr:hypothetical protein [Anaerolineae bacterium]